MGSVGRSPSLNSEHEGADLDLPEEIREWSAALAWAAGWLVAVVCFGLLLLPILNSVYQFLR